MCHGIVNETGEQKKKTIEIDGKKIELSLESFEALRDSLIGKAQQEKEG